MSERFHGGAAVHAGYYVNAARWAVEPIQRDGDRLPPGPGEWRRIPMLVALTLVPILGVTFLMFMPAAGFIVLGSHLARRLGRAVARRAAPAPAKAGEADRPKAG